MTERRGSGRNIMYWQAKCQRPGCGHSRAKHFNAGTYRCSNIAYGQATTSDGRDTYSMDRCECTGFQEVAQ